MCRTVRRDSGVEKGSNHRISIQQEGKRGGGRLFFLQIEPMWLTPAVLEGCWADGLGQLFQYMRKYNTESPKQGSRRFNSIVQTKYIANLGIVYLWLVWSKIELPPCQPAWRSQRAVPGPGCWSQLSLCQRTWTGPLSWTLVYTVGKDCCSIL